MNEIRLVVEVRLVPDRYTVQLVPDAKPVAWKAKSPPDVAAAGSIWYRLAKPDKTIRLRMISEESLVNFIVTLLAEVGVEKFAI